MSVRAHIAKKYQVEFNEVDITSADEALTFLDQIKELFPDGDAVTWHNEDKTAFELDREVLNEALDKDIDESLKDFCRRLLVDSDQSIHYIRLEIF